jgi:transcriptional regulator with XRE-family HTH domain
MNPFGDVMRDARTDAGLTLRDLEDATGVHYSYLSRIENDHLPHPPSEDVVRQICRVLGVNPDRGLLASGRVPEWFEEWLIEHPEVTLDIIQCVERGDETLPLKRVA